MTIWWIVIGLAVTTALVRAAGPVVFGGRSRTRPSSVWSP